MTSATTTTTVTSNRRIAPHYSVGSCRFLAALSCPTPPGPCGSHTGFVRSRRGDCLCAAVSITSCTSTTARSSAIGQAATTAAARFVSSSSTTPDAKNTHVDNNNNNDDDDDDDTTFCFGSYYTIEASNAAATTTTTADDVANKDAQPIATKLIVRGPDVDGILASMTMTLAIKGNCSLVELHAGREPIHMGACSHQHYHDYVGNDNNNENNNQQDPRQQQDDSYSLICDVFYVVNRQTGRPFADEELHELAVSLLEAAKSPLKGVMLVGKDSQQKHLAMKKFLQENVPVPTRPIRIIPSSSKGG